MHGARRVIVFCLLTAVLPTILLIIPLYLRHSVFSDVTYAVAESDILEINDGISSIFCQAHSLHMNTTFNAYQLSGKPELGENRKHIRLKKSMSLLDDTLEYWGFFLLKGSTVNLSVCSRFVNGRLLVVKGERTLRKCEPLQNSKSNNQLPSTMSDQDKVKVVFESYAQEIHPTRLETVKYDDLSIPRRNRDTTEAIDDVELENLDSGESNLDGLENFKKYAEFARNYIERHTAKLEDRENLTLEEKLVGRKLRHSRGRLRHMSGEGDSILTTENPQYNHLRNKLDKIDAARKRRHADIRAAHNLDAKVAHGGTAPVNETKGSEESSISSFENNLSNCYNGNILLNEGFQSSPFCTNTSFLELGLLKKKTTYEYNVLSDGYYYYIFYSDNDEVRNDIYAVFDIFKPTYQYANVSNKCLNQTECIFKVGLSNDEVVIVEVPTRDGIENEDDDITFLVSVCHPRMSVYIIFPILVLFLILGCAFL